jgi:hypothetical protein
MLQSWTQISLDTFVEANINSPANAIYMTMQEHFVFRNFLFYLDKDVVSPLCDFLLWGLIRFSTRTIPTNTNYACPELRICV